MFAFVAHAAGQSRPESTDALRIDEAEVRDLPGHAVIHEAPGEPTYWATESALFSPLPEGGFYRTRLEGMPPGAQLVPAVDLDTIRFASLPSTGVAVLLEGTAMVIGPWEPPRALPLERVGPDDGLTHVARAMRTCPSGTGPCLVIGDPRAVRAAQDPAEPSNGIILASRSAPLALDGRVVNESTLAVPGSTNVSLRVRRLTDGDRVIDSVSVVVRGAAHHAFDVEVLDGTGRPLEPRFTAASVGRRVYVHNFRGTVSVHDLRGRRIEPPHRVRAEYYYDICSGGDESWTVVPVFGPRKVEFAVIDLDGSAFVYPRLGRRSVRLSLGVDDARIWDIAHLERDGAALTPRFLRRN